MTIIVAQKTETGVMLGADNGMTEGPRIFRRANPKLVTIAEARGEPRIAVGTAGLVRLGDAVRTMSWPRAADCSLKKLGEMFRGLLKDEPNDTPFWALVAVDREIFYVGMGGSVTCVDAPYCALGSAEFVALGVLYLWNFDIHDMSAERAKNGLQHALKACAEHVEGIRPPWTFVETKAPA